MRALLLSGLSDSQKESTDGFAKRIDINGEEMVVCRHTPANIHRLRALKIPAPTLDVGHEFNHATPNFTYYDHQKVTAGFLSLHHRAWCLNGLRSGKTLSAIQAREILRSLGFHGRTLILSPENVVNESWGDSYKAVNPDLKIYVSDKTVAHLNTYGLRSDTDVVVLNHGKLPYCVEDVDKWDFDFLIVDEGSIYKSPDKEPVNNLNFLMQDRTVGDYISDKPSKRWLWALTGSPRPASGTDIWPLARLINPKLMWMTFGQWRKKVATFYDVKDRHGRFQFRQWTDRPEDEVAQLCAEKMKPSIRFRTEDCVDMPPQAYSYFHTPPTGDQKTLYNMIARHKAGKLGDGKYRVVTTPNKINKLLQAASGTIKDTDGNWVHIGAKSRMDALLDLYNQAEGKVVVFCTYTETADFIKAELKKKSIKCDIINRKVSKPQRERIRQSFQTDRRKSVLVMHPQTTRFGTNVSKASVTIWWIPPMHGEYWIQGNERMRQPGSGKTLVAMFYGSELEREYYRRVQGKQRGNDKTVDMYGEFRKTSKVDSTYSKQFLQNWDTDEH